MSQKLKMGGGGQSFILLFFLKCSGLSSLTLLVGCQSHAQKRPELF